MPKLIVMNSAKTNFDLNILTSVVQDALGDQFKSASSLRGASEINYRGAKATTDELLWKNGFQVTMQKFGNNGSARKGAAVSVATPRSGFDFSRNTPHI